MNEFDAVVVGSGPNGLAAAITLQQQGLDVLIVEGGQTIGGGLRSKELTLPGFIHDVCATVHPLAIGSPFFNRLPLKDFGLSFSFSESPLAHPIENTQAVILHRDLGQMTDELDPDAVRYRQSLESLVRHWDELSTDLLGPLRWPKNPALLARLGPRFLRSADQTARRFQSDRTRALFAGLAAHGMLPLHYLTTSAIGWVLAGLAHRVGWPVIHGGSQQLANALGKYFKSLGGQIVTEMPVTDVRELPARDYLLLDLTPQQLLKLKGLDFSAGYIRQLERYRYGMGVFKMDWALSEPIPFRDPRCRSAATVHIGGTFHEIKQSEYDIHAGRGSEKPYIILVQPSLSDPSRAPAGGHTAWAYCHVPHGSLLDMSAIIERQIERFAPGFKEVILVRSTMNTSQMEQYNPNYVGGDINGGQMDWRQLFTRPVRSLVPYRTSDPNVYLTSSSTPPGGGVHGLCGYHSARTLLRDHLNQKIDF